MTLIESSQRFLELRTALGSEFILRELRGAPEALSEPFRFELDFLAPLHAEVPFEKLIGQGVCVTCRPADGVARHYHGIVDELAEGGIVDNDYRAFEAVVVPDAWRWSKNRQCRIFQQQTVPQILGQVLARVKMHNRLQQTYLPRNYCAQYGESDFDFATRLMEEEGIFYFFTHSEDGHELVIADRSSGVAEVPGASRVRFSKVPAPGTRVRTWKKFQRLVPTRHVVRDYAFQMADKTLEDEASVTRAVAVGKTLHYPAAGWTEPAEVFRYPGDYAHHHDRIDPAGEGNSQALTKVFEESATRAERQADRAAAQSIRIEGSSNCETSCPDIAFGSSSTATAMAITSSPV